MLDHAEIQGLWSPVTLADRDNDPVFSELMALRGRVDHLNGGAVGGENGDSRKWASVANQAEEILARCNHLSVAAILVEAWTHSEGWAGFARGVHVAERLVATCWNHLMPPLVDGEAYKRGSALEGIVELVRLLYRAPLCGDATLSELRSQENDATHSATLARLPPERRDVASRAAASLKALSEGYRERAKEALQWDGLRQVVEEAESRMQALAQAAGLVADSEPEVVQGEEASQQGEAPRTNGTAQPAPPAAIRNREDVVRTLDKLCAYYAQHEPSSPVPLLLSRARRLVHMSFFEAVQDLADQGMGQLKVLLGPQDGEKKG